jgi:predicted transcriptional regulator
MKNRNRITPAEWTIMEAVWQLGRSVSVRDVLEHAFPNGERAYTTVQTMMNKLVGKRCLARAKTGMVNFYAPTRLRADMVRAEMSLMLSRVFNGSIPDLASSLLSLDDLSLDEIEDIKKLIDTKEDELRRGEE